MTSPAQPAETARATAQEWLSRVTADDLLKIIHGALRDGDMKAAAAGINLLAVKDPEAAATIVAVLGSVSVGAS